MLNKNNNNDHHYYAQMEEIDEHTDTWCAFMLDFPECRVTGPFDGLIDKLSEAWEKYKQDAAGAGIELPKPYVPGPPTHILTEQ